jgi:hypothetical protein
MQNKVEQGTSLHGKNSESDAVVTAQKSGDQLGGETPVFEKPGAPCPVFCIDCAVGAEPFVVRCAHPTQPLLDRSPQMRADEVIGKTSLTQLLANSQRSEAFTDTLCDIGLCHPPLAQQAASSQIVEQLLDLVRCETIYAQLAEKLEATVLSGRQ